MYPVDVLTDQDLITIQHWIEETTDVHVELDDIKNKTLREWNKSKIKLFKLFGRKLRITIPYTRSVDTYEKRERLYQYLNNVPLFIFFEGKEYFNDYIKINYPKQEYTYHNNPDYFEEDFFIYMLSLYRKNEVTFSQLKNIFLGCFHLENILSNQFRKYLEDNLDNVEKERIYFYYKDKRPLCIDLHSKVMRSLQKIIKYFDYPNIEQFLKWSAQISVITTISTYKTNLVLSIHPIDFMTSSDNNANWTSCMSWKENGCYNSGTIEMLNSNVTIIAYLENKDKKFTTQQGDIIPNKMWRTYCYIHKKIILIGNSYPNEDSATSSFILQTLMDLVQKKNNWTYRYKNENYQDMEYLDSEGATGTSIEDFTDFYRFKNRHSIIMTTDSMYNDMGTHSSENFICSRNYVKESIFINVSGKNTCIQCGKSRGKYGIQARLRLCHDCQCKLDMKKEGMK